MLKIERAGNGYRITAQETGLGSFTANAKDIDAVNRAVFHYYEPSKHTKEPMLCPFCIQQREEDERGPR